MILWPKAYESDVKDNVHYREEAGVHLAECEALRAEVERLKHEVYGESELKAQLCKRRIDMAEWVNFEKNGGPEMAGAYLVASAYTKAVGQALWLPREKEWKWPSAAMAFEMTHWAHMPSAPSDIA